MEPILRNFVITDWINILLFIFIGILVISKVLYKSHFQSFLLLFRSGAYFSMRDHKGILGHPSTVLFTFNHFLTVSFLAFLVQMTLKQEEPINSLETFLRIFLGYSILVLSKIVIERIVGNILAMDALSRNYLFEKTSYLNLLSLPIFLICCFISYSNSHSKSVIYIILGVIALLYLLSLLLVIRKYWDSIRSHPFYFILYFCALEIAPYYILYKVVI